MYGSLARSHIAPTDLGHAEVARGVRQLPERAAGARRERGRTELLDMKSGIEHWKAKGLDFSKVFSTPKMPVEVARFGWSTHLAAFEELVEVVQTVVTDPSVVEAVEALDDGLLDLVELA